MMSMGIKSGDRIREYRYERYIGHGAYSIVWEGFHTLLETRVAIKRIDTSRLDEKSIRRLKRECQIGGRLSRNDSIVTVKNAFEKDGYFYIVMELMSGGSLGGYLRGNLRPDLSLILDWATDLSVALIEVHKHDVVHRDIKPENILLTHELRVKLGDFGISHLPDSDLTTLYQPGTPAYRAPEQEANQKVDYRVDIYALCAVLFETLTGRKYVEFRNTDQKRIRDEMVLLLTERYPDLSRTWGRRLGQVVLAGLRPAQERISLPKLCTAFRTIKSNWGKRDHYKKHVEEPHADKPSASKPLADRPTAAIVSEPLPKLTEPKIEARAQRRVFSEPANIVPGFSLGKGGTTPSINDTLLTVQKSFDLYMKDQGFSRNTQKSFNSDIRLLGKYLGVGKPIGEIEPNDLNAFLNWLVNERGTPCSPKSYARRVSTLRVFFGWLHEAQVVTTDLAVSIIPISVKSPLPDVPSDEELKQALAVTSAIRHGSISQDPDARPHLLLTLLLQTGIKKGEAMAIELQHIRRDPPEAPFIFVRYKNPKMRNKERKLRVDPEWFVILDEYLDQYSPVDILFTCSARNLEYILRDVADTAGLEKGLINFGSLRWASALRDFKNSVELDQIRQKLGLSKITWRETRAKLEALAEPDIV